MNTLAKQIIEDLRKDIEDLLNLESNIEVIWQLEKLAQDKAFLKSAELLRKSLNIGRNERI